MYNNCNNVNGN